MRRLALTAAQTSALECREGGGLDDLRALDRAWDRKQRLLWVLRSEANCLLSDLIDAANAEDAQAIEHCDRAARGAATALSNLAGKVAAVIAAWGPPP